MGNRIATALLLCASAVFPVPGAQNASPPRRAHHAMIYDDTRQRVLLSGGSTPVEGGRSFEFYNDLWAFDGSRWTALGTSGGKASGTQLAFDVKRGRIVSFGGYDGRGSLSDVRVLAGDVWEPLGMHSEMPAAEPGFVYDVKRERFVAFGGSAGRGQAHGETWQYDGTQWLRLAIVSPPARQAHSMVYDAKRDRIVVFGGMGAGSAGQPPPVFGDTWEFDGTAWIERKVSGPSPRNGAGVAYDSRRGLVILFGGAGKDGFKGDTWSWDGAQWRLVAQTGPEPRVMGYLAYDKRRDRVVLFGGRKGYPDGDLNDTWEWDGMRWRRIGG